MLLWCFEYSYYSSPLRYLLVNIKINVVNYCHHYSFEMLLDMWYIESRISCMLNYYFTDEYCSLCPLDKHCFICSILTVTRTITDSMANLVVFHKIHIEPSYVAKRTFDIWKIHYSYINCMNTKVQHAWALYALYKKTVPPAVSIRWPFETMWMILLSVYL